MKIFIEHRGSNRHPWLCLLAENIDEKRELENLFWDVKDDNRGFEKNAEWQQQDFKLMLCLR